MSCCQTATAPQNTKIPSPGPAAPGSDIDARLAEKLRLRTQISPSRIPRCRAAAAAQSAPAAKDQGALIPTHARTDKHGQHHHELSEHREPSKQRLQQQHQASQQVKKAASTQSHSPGKLPNLHKPAHQSSEQTPHQQEQQEPLQPWSTQQQLAQHHQQQNQQPHQRSQHTAALKQHGLQQHSSLGHNVHTGTALSGIGASRKLHEFLLTQQRKREQYWLSKYGKLLGPAAPASLGKPCPNPASLHRHPTNSIANRNSPVKLPSLPTSYASSNTSAVVNATGQLSECCQLPLLSSGCSEQAGVAAADASNIGHELQPANQSQDASSVSELQYAQQQQWQLAEQQGQQQQLQHLQQQLGQQLQTAQQDQQQDEAFERLLNAKVTLASVPKLSVTTCLASKVAAAGCSGTGSIRGCGSSSCSDAGLSGQPSRQLPCRDLEAELQVLRAIKAREDALDKLKACCSRLEADLGGKGGAVLLPSDPLGRLFYRLVANLRLKTLDVVEAHAAWARKVSAPEPFTYKGRPYLAAMPQSLAFLDAASWLAGRLLRCKAVEDVLLAEVTADGVPLDAVTSFDMRRGPSHFSPEALRIRMARKVLAAAGVQQPPHISNCLVAANQQQQQHAHGMVSHLQSNLAEERMEPDDWQQQQQSNCEQQDPLAAAAAAAATALGILTARKGGVLSGCLGGNDVHNTADLAPCFGAADHQEGASQQDDFTQCEPHSEPAMGGMIKDHSQAEARLLQLCGGEPAAQEQQLLPQETAAIDQQVLCRPDDLPLHSQHEQRQLQADKTLACQTAGSWRHDDVIVNPGGDAAAAAAADEIEEMLQALVASLEGHVAAKVAAFTFSYNDWVIDELLNAVTNELEQQEFCAAA